MVDPVVKDLNKKAIVKISKDFEIIVLCYKKENYALTNDEKYGYKQQIIPHLNKKRVNKIYQVDSEFFFISFTDYDYNFKVISYSEPNFDMRIHKMCEPGKLMALDVA